MKRWAKRVLVSIAVMLCLLFFVESVTSIAWYQKNKRGHDSISSTLDILNYLLSKFNNDPRLPSQLEKILELREKNVQAYQWYIFDPQLHTDFPVYHLANPIESTVVFCNNNVLWEMFETDEIGFRNPKGQLGKDVDFIFIGDSFTEGACVKDNDTLAGVFRKNGFSLLNLGRGGSGPLFQLATLREYGKSVNPRTVVWIVFTGDDLSNLRVEKTSDLFSYIADRNYSQDLLGRRIEVSKQIESFLNGEIELKQERQRLGYPDPLDSNCYGKSLDKIEAERKESVLLKKVAREILRVSKGLGATLFVVLINHPSYDHTIQDITSTAIIDFAEETSTGYVIFPRDELTSRKDFFYTKKGPHFSVDGYKFVAEKILDARNSHY